MGAFCSILSRDTNGRKEHSSGPKTIIKVSSFHSLSEGDLEGAVDADNFDGVAEANEAVGLLCRAQDRLPGAIDAVHELPIAADAEVSVGVIDALHLEAALRGDLLEASAEFRNFGFDFQSVSDLHDAEARLRGLQERARVAARETFATCAKQIQDRLHGGWRVEGSASNPFPVVTSPGNFLGVLKEVRHLNRLACRGVPLLVEQHADAGIVRECAAGHGHEPHGGGSWLVGYECDFLRGES